MPKTIYFVAGEASGDNHGAALMRSLRELSRDCQFIGRGGPQMKVLAGEQFHNWIDSAGVVGLWEVVKHLGYFRQQFRQTLNEIEKCKPDAIVLIDYPGFNLRLARTLRQQASRRKIIYYISPQVWAWNRGRITQMAHHLDLMLCIFPFEAELYNKSGLRTKFVGHPMVDRLRAQRINVERDPNLVGLFPGSRRREVAKIFPILLETTRELGKAKPNLRFEISAASAELAKEIRRLWHRLPGDDHRQDADATIKVGDAAGLMQRAFAGIVASGSATLEAAYFRLPFVLVYKVSWLTYIAGRLVVSVKHLGMPNVLAGKEVVPEFIQHDARPHALTEATARLIDDSAVRERMISDFDKIIATLGEGGASMQAARAIVQELA
ncbi:MAG: lipid-A-disaccharide synthase [Verrucomicrobiota bacterium]|nr:lipid-A-disaccharide synthase [Verrucomicrobiota bacterium]